MRFAALVALLSIGCHSSSPSVTTEEPVKEADKARASATLAATIKPNCDVLYSHWQAEILGDDPDPKPDPEVLAEYEERVKSFPCELEADLDQDGQSERVFITGKDAGPVGIGVVWGDGRETVLGAGQATRILPTGEDADLMEEDNFDWIVHWKPIGYADGAFRSKVLGSERSYAASDALGDGLYISSGDAAAIFYVAADGWHWMHLGF